MKPRRVVISFECQSVDTAASIKSHIRNDWCDAENIEVNTVSKGKSPEFYYDHQGEYHEGRPPSAGHIGRWPKRKKR